MLLGILYIAPVAVNERDEDVLIGGESAFSRTCGEQWRLPALAHPRSD
jgi:hypothetical protein